MSSKPRSVRGVGLVQRLCARATAFRGTALLSAGAMLTPVLAVQALRMVLGQSGPTAATASTSQPGPALNVPTPPGGAPQTSAARPAMTPQQTAAAAWLAANRQTLPTGNPMYRTKPVVQAPPLVEGPVDHPTSTPSAADGPHSDPIPPEVRQLRLSAVIRSVGTGTQRASINGRLHSIGDEVVKGWRLLDIEVGERRVVLKGPDGIEVYLNQLD